MSELYSPERRTALVLTGTGADGAYHAGVLRALQESGIKIDVVCGRGIGAVGAVLAAIDGSSRLWDAKGLWRVPAVATLYGWRWPLRVLFGALVAVALVLASPLVLLGIGLLAYLIGLLLGMSGLDLGSAVLTAYHGLLAAAFAPPALPTWLPRVVTAIILFALIVLVAGSYAAWRAAPLRRRSRGRASWALAGTPLDATRAMQHFVNGVWDLLKGGAAVKTPAADDLSRRYAEVLTENLGQLGFAELLITVHDLDAHRDLVFGLVREPFRRALFPARAAGHQWARGDAAEATARRRAEAFDLAGVASHHLVDVLRASLTIPELSEPVLVQFAADTHWRGETHRLVDRPGSLARLLEEAAAAGAEQVIVVSAAPAPGGPHGLVRPRLNPLGRLSEHIASVEAAVLRDALSHLQHRFRAVYQIRPGHNPLGAFDLDGAFDERSDRRHTLVELIERGYDDAYREFIEPVVATSGERLGAAPQP